MEKNKKNIRDDIKAITSEHQTLNSSYTEFIENNKQKWVNEITEIHTKNDVSQIKNKGWKFGHR